MIELRMVEMLRETSGISREKDAVRVLKSYQDNSKQRYLLEYQPWPGAWVIWRVCWGEAVERLKQPGLFGRRVGAGLQEAVA